MTAFNPEISFKPILAKIKNGQTKTTHQLRLILDELSKEFNASPLSLLVDFREWLLKDNIELSTTDGMVSITVGFSCYKHSCGKSHQRGRKE